eukprot:7295013-Prymnesium_polylepis.2
MLVVMLVDSGEKKHPETRESSYTGRSAGVWEYDQRRKLECGRPDGGGGTQVLWWTQAEVRNEMWRAVVGWARGSHEALCRVRCSGR